MRRAVLFFMCQLALYGLVAFNVRALASGNIPATVITDLLIASVSFTVLRRIGDASRRLDFVGYALGGACGSIIALLVARS